MEKKGFEARMKECRGDGRREWWRDQEKVMNLEEIDEVEDGEKNQEAQATAGGQLQIRYETENVIVRSTTNEEH